MAVESNGDRTMNPMVNAGAIAATSLVPGSTPEEKWKYVQKDCRGLPGVTFAER